MIKWQIFTGFLFVLFISYRIFRRMSGKNLEPKNLLGCGYVFLVYGSLTALSIPFLFMTSNSLVTMASGDTYTGVIIDYETIYSEDDEGTSITYAPIVEVTIEGETIRHKSNFSSSSLPKIGKEVKVAYNPKTDRITIKSLGNALLLFAGLLFAMLLFSFVVFGAMYAFGINRKSPIEFVLGMFVRYVLPIGSIAFTGLLGYALYDNIINPSGDIPIWAMLLLGFFFLIMVLVLKPILNMAWGKETVSNSTQSTDYSFLGDLQQSIIHNYYDEPSCKIDDTAPIIEASYQAGKPIYSLIPELEITDDVNIQFDNHCWNGEDDGAEKDQESLNHYLTELFSKDWASIIRADDDYTDYNDQDDIEEWLSGKSNEDIILEMNFEIDWW